MSQVPSQSPTSPPQPYIDGCRDAAVRAGWPCAELRIVEDLYRAAATHSRAPVGNEPAYREMLSRLRASAGWRQSVALTTQYPNETISLLTMRALASFQHETTINAHPIGALSVSPFSELVVASAADARGDHRLLDVAAIGLYCTGLALDFPSDSLLAAYLRQLRQLDLGADANDNRQAIGGLRGLTRHGEDLANVLDSERCDTQLFLAKLANDELLYWQRATPHEKPLVAEFRFRIWADSQDGPDDRASYASWAKALTLWMAHDLAWHVGRHLGGLRHRISIVVAPLRDGESHAKGVETFFWLDEVPRSLADDPHHPWLMSLPALRPLLRRVSLPTEKPRPSGDPLRIDGRRRRERRETRRDACETRFSFSLDVVCPAGAEALRRSTEVQQRSTMLRHARNSSSGDAPRVDALVRLGEQECRLEPSRQGFEGAGYGEFLKPLRRRVLELITQRMIHSVDFH